MQRYILSIISISLFLSGCTLPGTQKESENINANTVIFETDSISVLVPKSWSGTKLSDIPSPRFGSVVGAYISPETKGWFSNNLVILRDTLDQIMTSKRYSELNNLQTTKNYLEYTKLKDTEFTFGDSETSRIYVFEARYNQTTPRMKFIQTARVCGTRVYLLHFSLALDKDATIYSKLLESFTCK